MRNLFKCIVIILFAITPTMVVAQDGFSEVETYKIIDGYAESIEQQQSRIISGMRDGLKLFELHAIKKVSKSETIRKDDLEIFKNVLSGFLLGVIKSKVKAYGKNMDGNAAADFKGLSMGYGIIKSFIGGLDAEESRVKAARNNYDIYTFISDRIIFLNQQESNSNIAKVKKVLDDSLNIKKSSPDELRTFLESLKKATATFAKSGYDLLSVEEYEYITYIAFINSATRFGQKKSGYIKYEFALSNYEFSKIYGKNLISETGSLTTGSPAKDYFQDVRLKDINKVKVSVVAPYGDKIGERLNELLAGRKGIIPGTAWRMPVRKVIKLSGDYVVTLGGGKFFDPNIMDFLGRSNQRINNSTPRAETIKSFMASEIQFYKIGSRGVEWVSN